MFMINSKPLHKSHFTILNSECFFTKHLTRQATTVLQRLKYPTDLLECEMINYYTRLPLNCLSISFHPRRDNFSPSTETQTTV